MPQELHRELKDLVAVHKFYMQLLRKQMGHDVPVPQEVSNPDITIDRLAQSIDVLRRWLLLLDMAISAPMVRDALKEPTEHPTAEALYRHYILKAAHSESDRDKTDFLGTYLLRNPAPDSGRAPATPGGHSGETYSYMFSQKQAQEFQAEIEQMLGVPVPDMPAEHQQLLREFQYLHQEADEFRHFDQIMDSGILQRVRELKNKFANSFYHPRVLAASAVYNVFFGKRFDDLFRDAASQIKAFAAKVEKEGGSIMSRVDGDVTVKHLQEVEESNILKQEYGRAKEHFQKVSKFKKAVDSRRSGRPSAAAAAANPSNLPPAVAARAARPAGVQSIADAPGRTAGGANPVEENKIKGLAESIRNFVRSNEGGNVVSIRNLNVALTPGELEAFKSDYGTEKSFRADYAAMLTYIVGLHTRMHQEMDDYKSKRSSAYLWKPHADSLAYLISAGNKGLEEGTKLVGLAEQRGLGDKAKSMQATVEKLRTQINIVAQTLQT
ncbi:MAG TPA: hypothetical protein VGR50_02335 [Terriglobales bacterium]|nr:hypothetical protein [Terriglobales bacterium]